MSSSDEGLASIAPGNEAEAAEKAAEAAGMAALPRKSGLNADGETLRRGRGRAKLRQRFYDWVLEHGTPEQRMVLLTTGVPRLIPLLSGPIRVGDFAHNYNAARQAFATLLEPDPELEQRRDDEDVRAALDSVVGLSRQRRVEKRIQAQLEAQRKSGQLGGEKRRRRRVSSRRFSTTVKMLEGGAESVPVDVEEAARKSRPDDVLALSSVPYSQRAGRYSANSIPSSLSAYDAKLLFDSMPPEAPVTLGDEFKGM